MNVKVVVLVLLVGFALPTFAGERVSLRVTPAVAFAPANIIVRATVESNKDNRAIEVIAESTDFDRSSVVSLDGDRAPRVTLLQFKSVPSGQYLVRAVVKDVAGRELAPTDAHVNIMTEGGF